MKLHKIWWKFMNWQFINNIQVGNMDIGGAFHTMIQVGIVNVFVSHKENVSQNRDVILPHTIWLPKIRSRTFLGVGLVKKQSTRHTGTLAVGCNHCSYLGHRFAAATKAECPCIIWPSTASPRYTVTSRKTPRCSPIITIYQTDSTTICETKLETT